MKKLSLFALVGAVLFAGSAMAQTRCSYTLIQDKVRMSNSPADIQQLINRRVNLNAPVKCGGTVAQLAILRGNADVLEVLLKNGVNAKEMVNMNSGFRIDGAPNEIPVLFFAARFAPNAEIVKTLIQNGADPLATDKNGETIMWYLNENPVLVETDLAKKLEEDILFSSGDNNKEADQQNTEKKAPAQPAF